MKTLKALCLFIIAACFLNTATAQNSQNSQTEKNKIFEFTVHGKLSSDDAAKISAQMMTRKGIIECKTDVQRSRVTIKAIPQMDFVALRDVMNYLGYEVSTENLVIRDE